MVFKFYNITYLDKGKKEATSASFVSQYGKPNGIDLEDAQKLIGVADKDIVGGKTSVSGEDVKDLAGSDILKIDIRSAYATDQRMFNQLLFGVDNSRALGIQVFYHLIIIALLKK